MDHPSVLPLKTSEETWQTKRRIDVNMRSPLITKMLGHKQWLVTALFEHSNVKDTFLSSFYTTKNYHGPLLQSLWALLVNLLSSCVTDFASEKLTSIMRYDSAHTTENQPTTRFSKIGNTFCKTSGVRLLHVFWGQKRARSQEKVSQINRSNPYLILLAAEPPSYFCVQWS